MRNDIRTGLDNVDYFKSIPWAAEIINQQKYEITPTLSRVVKGSTEDSFFAETLHTERTIRKCLTLSARPSNNSEYPIQEVLTLFELGNGLNGFPNISHGGFVATMLDEEMGILLTVNQEHLNKQTGKNDELSSLTAYINIRYLAPVRTPGIVLGTAKVTKSEGRKIYARGTIEDENRRELAVAECLFIKAKSDPRANI
jgi:thioesterase superfamily protein 4